MRTLTLGKLQGMRRIASARGVIAVTALDHRGSLQSVLEQVTGRPVGFAELAAEKIRMGRVLAPLSTAVLLDPLYGVPALLQGTVPAGVGLVMCLEEYGYEGSAEGRLTAVIKGWSVAKIKRIGASAVKLLLFYHPRSSVAARQEAFLAEVAEECRRYDIPLLVEPICYPIEPGRKKESPEFARERPDLVIERPGVSAPSGWTC